jgi:hypothetical protein
MQSFIAGARRAGGKVATAIFKVLWALQSLDVLQGHARSLFFIVLPLRLLLNVASFT